MVWHPREGWTPEGRRRPSELSRRDFLTRAAGASLAVGGLGSFLEACGGKSGGGSGFTGPTSNGIPLPRPDHPVTWPIFGDNKPIASGLKPETGATLKLYNWVAYINPASLKAFGKKYNCKVELTTFNTMEEAIAKLRSGQLEFDVFVPTIDQIGPLIESKLLRPLNHSYIPNIADTWPDYKNPFYDQHWRYTVPYTIYTTGISWRKDHVHESPYQLSNGYQFPWLYGSKYKGKVALLDDYREATSLGLMKNNIFDLNTTSTSKINLAKNSLLQLSQEVGGVHIDNNDYTNVPSGQIWIHHSWSGDMAASPYYLPKGVSPKVIGYWFPTDGKGPVNNDTLTILANAKNPVLAHLFLNYFLDTHNAFENYSYTGYMQPVTAMTPQKLVQEQLLDPNLISTAVLPSYFRHGLFELQLPATANTAWQQAWLQVSKGV